MPLEHSTVEHENKRFGWLSVSNSALLAVFCISTLVSALLLFLIQPMFTKMALPLLGGAPSVWNTAMVFFQFVLLAGYLYAHLLSKSLSFRLQVLVHGIVLFSAALFLPIAIPESWNTPEAAGTPMLWIIGLFGVALGAPFFALSANAPLLQRWFSFTNHPAAKDPYFLYAASNLGSLFALLGYPVIFEPAFKLSEQAWYWSVGFLSLVFLIVASGFAGNSRILQSREQQDPVEAASQAIGWKLRLHWIACAMLPSALMLGVTTHITLNVASAPFLWVLPLAIYLLTFIFAFSPKPVFGSSLLDGLFPLVALAILLSISFHALPFSADLLLHLTGYFAIAMMCHSKLASARPSPDRLTEFYIMMSLGGVLGGAIVALAAPMVFDGAYEYPLLVIAAALFIGTGRIRMQYPFRELLILSAVIATALLVVFASADLRDDLRFILALAVISGLLCFGVLYRQLPVRLFSILVGIWIIFFNFENMFSDENRLVMKERSFFGTATVRATQTDHGPAHFFIHGNTLHNIQLRNDDLQTYPLAYYAPQGAFGQTIQAMRKTRQNMQVAAIGLGAGALACHAKPGDDWRFFEIDPLVAKMAMDPSKFSFLERCGPDMPIKIGDARLTLTKVPPGSQDLVIVDAFSSDSVPVHLITKEALALYLSRVKDDGLVFFHTSNRYLNVSAVVTNLAKSAGLKSRKIVFKPDPSDRFFELIKPSTAVVVGTDSALKKVLTEQPDWQEMPFDPLVGVWTDDFSHIIGAMRAHVKLEDQ